MESAHYRFKSKLNGCDGGFVVVLKLSLSISSVISIELKGILKRADLDSLPTTWIAIGSGE